MRRALVVLARFRRLALAIPLVLTTAGAPIVTGCSDSSTGPSGGKCCRVCKEGKPCGDTCIARTSTCRTSGGCACSG